MFFNNEHMFFKNEHIEFKNNNSFDTRLKNSARLLLKYLDRIPLIIEVNKGDKNTLILDKHKYLVPIHLTLSQFMCVIRKRVSINSDEALFIFINGNLPVSSETMGNIYKLNKDKDGFLYAIISFESTFG